MNTFDLTGYTYKLDDRVRKIKGSRWQGKIVGFYSTALTPYGYCVESDTEVGSVQIYPESALEAVTVYNTKRLNSKGVPCIVIGILDDRYKIMPDTGVVRWVTKAAFLTWPEAR